MLILGMKPPENLENIERDQWLLFTQRLDYVVIFLNVFKKSKESPQISAIKARYSTHDYSRM